MSVTMFVALGFWLCGALIEAKLRVNWAWFDRMMSPRIDPNTGVEQRSLFRVLFQFASAGVIGFALTAITGPAVGVGAALGQMAGLATNDFTNKLINHWTPATVARGRQIIAKVDTTKQWMADHPQTVSDFRTGVKGFFMAIAAFFVLLGKIIRFVGVVFAFLSNPIGSVRRMLNKEPAINWGPPVLS